MNLKRFYRKENMDLEYCFYVETNNILTAEELKVLQWLLAKTFEPQNFGRKSFLTGGQIVELGPRMNFETAFSTNAISICHACGLKKITRIEVARRHIVPTETDFKQFIAANHDRMTECRYNNHLATFSSGIKPEKVYTIPLIENGPDALLQVPGLAMDEWDRNYYWQYFVQSEKRNPTIVEIMDLNNANSEHCRHGFFKGKQIIDGQEMPETLMEIVQSTLGANPNNSVLAFKDNSSAIRGYDIWTIIPRYPGKPSQFTGQRVKYHIIFTAETHNYPSGIEPFQGATTGTGGRIRDGEATGRGSVVTAATAGYCVANLEIPDYNLPWEEKKLPRPTNLASPLKIEIRASDGASDYGKPCAGKHKSDPQTLVQRQYLGGQMENLGRGQGKSLYVSLRCHEPD